MLRREIKRWDLFLLMINSIIGAGIFGLPSKIFALSGIYSLPALFLCAAIVLILVFNFAEVASRFSKTGGPYLYTLSAFGKIPAFIVGWLILITRLATYAALIHLIVTYLGYFLPALIEPGFRFAAIVTITIILTIVNYRGVRQSTLLSNTLAIAKVLPLLVFIVVGLFYLDPQIIDFRQATPDIGDFSSTVLVLIFAFTGFEAVLVNTGEVRDPGKNIPFALIASILFVAVFYALIQVVSIGTLPELATSDKPLTDAAQIFMGPFGGILITIGAVISIGGTLNAVMLIGSRVPFALSQEEQLPVIFSHLHKRFSTPVTSLLVFSAASLLVSLTGSFIYAVSISVISKVLIFLAVCLALIRLRRKKDAPSEQFRLPYGRAFAIAGAAASIALLYSSRLSELGDVFYTVLIGIILYAIFRIVSAKTKREKRDRRQTMDISVFTDKSKTPTDNEVQVALGKTYAQWKSIRDIVFERYPAAKEEWNYPGAKYGWSYRIKDKKRAILYLLPRDGYFKVAFVFGQKATDQILSSEVSERIKSELKSARVYVEGRGIRIPVNKEADLRDIKTLVEVKLAN